MPVKKGDILDEHKRHPEGCGLVVKVMGGGEGFQKILCCGHELTEDDVVSKAMPSKGRRQGKAPLGVVLDEKKHYPDSCGLRVIIMEGGAGFQGIHCCGHILTGNSVHEFKFGGMGGLRGGEEGPAGQA